jgi:Copper transport outer membrane protein, MctB
VIDFRYHLVSIVAVFLALAVGLVVGATALTPRTAKFFDTRSKQEQQTINAQRAQIKSLQDQLNSDQAAAKADAPLVLGNLLAGQDVVLVTAPGADGATISGVTTALLQAGAKVTGQAELQPAFFDTSASTQNSLETLARRVVPPGVTLGPQAGQLNADAQIAGQQEAAQVLAPALVTKAGADLPATQTKAILDGFAQQGFLQMNLTGGSPARSQAMLAVVIIPAAPPASGGSDLANLALLALAEQLELSSRGVVLAGSLAGSGAGSAIDELINGNTGIRLSSVDDADTEVGQIEVAQALSFMLSGHQPDAYGVLPGAAPSPAPTPTASPTPPVKNKSRR